MMSCTRPIATSSRSLHREGAFFWRRRARINHDGSKTQASRSRIAMSALHTDARYADAAWCQVVSFLQQSCMFPLWLASQRALAWCRWRAPKWRQSAINAHSSAPGGSMTCQRLLNASTAWARSPCARVGPSRRCGTFRASYVCARLIRGHNLHSARIPPLTHSQPHRLQMTSTLGNGSHGGWTRHST